MPLKRLHEVNDKSMQEAMTAANMRLFINTPTFLPDGGSYFSFGEELSSPQL